MTFTANYSIHQRNAFQALNLEYLVQRIVDTKDNGLLCFPGICAVLLKWFTYGKTTLIIIIIVYSQIVFLKLEQSLKHPILSTIDMRLSNTLVNVQKEFSAFGNGTKQSSMQYLSFLG